MALIAKVAATRLPGTQVAFVRFCVGLLACAAAWLRSPLRAHNRVGLFLRGLYGGAAVLCYFVAIEHLPVGLATLLNYTAPVFTAIYAALFLGEGVRGSTLAALVLTSAGVVCVVKGQAPAGSLGLSVWPLVAMISAVLSGAAVATIREVRRTDGSWEIFAAFCVGGALITGVPALLTWTRPSPAEWVALTTVGLTSVVAQLMMTYALRFVRAAIAGIIAQLTPVAALALGALLLHDQVAPLAIAGAVVTIGGATWGAYLASRGRSVPVEDP